jgi:hypothetical protein
MDTSDDRSALLWPLNLPKKEKLEILRELTVAEKFALARELSMQEKRRWTAALRQEFPHVTKKEFEQIVIRKLLERGEEEARIARQLAQRDERTGSRQHPT